MDKHGMSHDLVRGSTLPDMTGAMQVFVYGLPRIPLLRTPVNKGIKKGRDCSRPRPRKYLPLVGTHPSLAAMHSPKLPYCLLNCSC
jgi:hypothetical protein